MYILKVFNGKITYEYEFLDQVLGKILQKKWRNLWRKTILFYLK